MVELERPVGLPAPTEEPSSGEGSPDQGQAEAEEPCVEAGGRCFVLRSWG